MILFFLFNSDLAIFLLRNFPFYCRLFNAQVALTFFKQFCVINLIFSSILFITVA